MDKNLVACLAKNNIIGTQLVKKNDQLALQDDKIKFLQLCLDEREKEYQQRVDDIRLLKLEIQTLRHEKKLLSSGISNMVDLRQEVFNLERELNHERIRARALEELMKTPQNIHRWTKLQNIDPSSFELLEQVNILQKQALEKSQKLKEVKALCDSQRVQLLHSTDRGLKHENLALKKKLTVQAEKIKGLIAELKMKQYQLEHCKPSVPSRSKFPKCNSNIQIKKTYQDDRFCESAPVRTKTSSNYSEKSPIDKPKKFFGGGFNIMSSKETKQ